MGLFGNDKIDGMFEKAKETLKDTTDKTKKAFAESSEQMKQHNAESKNMKAPVEGAIIRYGVTYNGGLAKYHKAQSGEIGLNVLEDCFYLKPTMTTVEWFEEMAIPYEKIKKLEIVERKISNAEWLLSSSRSDMKAMEQKNNIEISYIDSDNKNQLIRLEMLTGVSIYGQAGKCVEFMDVLRQNDIPDKFIKETTQNTTEAQVDVLGQIEKLSELKEKGILSDEEFNSKKEELLKKL